MTKFQAAMKDIAARKLQERKHYYPKGRCQNCGGQIFKAYDPSWLKWRTMCWTCSEKDVEQAAKPKARLIKREVSTERAQSLRDRFDEILSSGRS